MSVTLAEILITKKAGVIDIRVEPWLEGVKRPWFWVDSSTLLVSPSLWDRLQDDEVSELDKVRA